MTYVTTKQEAREFYADIACNRYDLDQESHTGGCPAEDMWNEWFKSEIRKAQADALKAAARAIRAQFGTETVMGELDSDEVEFPTWLRNRAQRLMEES